MASFFCFSACAELTRLMGEQAAKLARAWETMERGEVRVTTYQRVNMGAVALICSDPRVARPYRYLSEVIGAVLFPTPGALFEKESFPKFYRDNYGMMPLIVCPHVDCAAAARYTGGDSATLKAAMDLATWVRARLIPTAVLQFQADGRPPTFYFDALGKSDLAESLRTDIEVMIGRPGLDWSYDSGAEVVAINVAHRFVKPMYDKVLRVSSHKFEDREDIVRTIIKTYGRNQGQDMPARIAPEIGDDRRRQLKQRLEILGARVLEQAA